MRKTLLMSAMWLAAAGVCAQAAVEPKILKEFYAQKISPDGHWIYSNAGLGEVVIYDLQTDNYFVFSDISLGNGNSISLNGTCVGNTETGRPLVIKDGNQNVPAAFADYWYANINGITADGTRVVGLVDNPNNGGTADEDNQMYFPFVADLDADGNCGELTFLPHPAKDFIGMVPQYSSATWISDDGKTILGQMVDYSGMSIQPIYYRQDETGEWKYFLPSESLFNPENIKLPDYPGEFDYSLQPNPKDYMTPEKAEEYDEDMEFWRDHLDDPDVAYPDDHLEDYMDSEQIAAYNAAVDKYNKYLTKYNEEIAAFMEVRNAIFDSSPAFVQNASAMNGEGTLASLTSVYAVDNGGFMPESRYGAYSLDIVSGKLTKINTENNDLIAGQVVDGGIFISSTPNGECPAAYVYLPGAADFIPVQDYLMQGNPGAADWMKENLLHELASGNGGGVDPYSEIPSARESGRMGLISGLGMASRDFTVFAGAVPAYMFDPVLYYLTYVFSDLTSSVKPIMVEAANQAVRAIGNGVLSISDEVSSIEIYDFSGRKVFGAQNISGVVETNLSQGIYVVAFTDANGNRHSLKCKM